MTDTKKVKAIYALLENDIEEWEEDDITDEFWAELNKRSLEMKEGKENILETYTWDDI